MERDYAIEVLQREAHRVLDLVDEDEERLRQTVPCCPGWVLTDVVKHLGNVYNWAGTIVESRLSEPPDRDAIPRRPEDMSYPAWMADRLDRLVFALGEAPPDVAVWTFSSRASTPAFWWRRQAQETLIHRVDAETASETPITIVDPSLGADNVDELFEIMAFTVADADAAQADSKAPANPPHAAAGWPASVHLHATDLDGAEWTIDTEARSVSRRHSKADVALKGPAWALARWCWGRPALAELETFGDLDAGESWRKSVVA